MKFLWNGRKVDIKGNVALTRLEATYETLIKLMDDETEGFWIEMVQQEGEALQETKQNHPNIIELLFEFKPLFHEPKGLPPKRLHDLAIKLIERAPHLIYGLSSTSTTRKTKSRKLYERCYL